MRDDCYHPVAGILHTPAPADRKVIIRGPRGVFVFQGVVPSWVPPSVYVVDCKVLDLTHLLLTIIDRSKDRLDVAINFPTADALVDAAEAIHAVLHGG